MSLKCARAPCKSCPYRKDVPSGVWDSSEYDKLPKYDGDIPDQLREGGIALFYCHQKDGNLCAGWVGCHGPEHLLALRLNAVDKCVWDYKSPVPLFSSGKEASFHGKRDILNPGNKAKHTISRLVRKA